MSSEIKSGEVVEWPVDVPAGPGGRRTGTVDKVDNGYAYVRHTIEIDGQLVEVVTVVALARCRRQEDVRRALGIPERT